MSQRPQAADPRAIAARIARALGTPDLVDALVALPQNELTSLLLEVFRRRSPARTPAELLAQYQRTRAVAPSNVDGATNAALAAHAHAAAAGFEPLALAPVAPVGLNAVLGGIDQNNTLGALRGLEVLADPTTVLALEAATRRKRGAAEARLCAFGRMLRLQPFDNPAFSPHFSIFGMITAARDGGGFAFETAALVEQLRVQLRFLARLAADGYRIADIRVELADTARDPRRLALCDGIFAALAAEFPTVAFAIDPARTHAVEYYRGLCLHVVATDVHGERQQIGDGGFVDWTQRLLSNGKERLLVSGFGVELLPRRFR